MREQEVAMKRMLVLTLSLAALAGLTPPQLRAQDPSFGEAPRTRGERFLDYFVSRNRLAQGDGSRTELDAIGGRLTWPLAAVAGRELIPLAERVSVGGYLVHTPADAEETSMWHYGVEADFRATDAPLAGRVDPLLSLGVGAVRVEEPRSPGAGNARTSLSMVPGVGARVRLVPRLAFRSDLRMVVDFRERTTRNVELSGGLSLPL
jgi:hypothetical protein